MKLHHIIASLVTAVGFSAVSAQEATLLDTSMFQSVKSRADVRAEAAGVVHSGEVTVFAHDATGPSNSRAQVIAEAREAARLGVLSRGEASTFIAPAQLEQIRVAGLNAANDMPLAKAR